MSDEDFEFAVNEVAMFFDENDNLAISFGDGRDALLELDNEREREVIKLVLADVNTWAVFLSSLSAALRKHV